MNQEVTLEEILLARESRGQAQQELMDRLGLTLISFSLNIAGPVKNSPLLRRAFGEGLTQLDNMLTAASLKVVERHQLDRPTGCEALWAVCGGGRQVKMLCVFLEEHHPLGRLFDLDVLDPEQGKWDRADLGLPPRRCIVCGREGKGCASRRLHPVEKLQQVTNEIMTRFFAHQDCGRLADLAGRALLYEVCTTPKPGLVDRRNNGSHRDMDLFTFLDSTAALLPYFRQAIAIGQETALLPPEETFLQLRPAGIGAEQAMAWATSGVNTHKGSIFSLGTVCAAVGRLWQPEGNTWEISRLLKECASMTSQAIQADFAAMAPENTSTIGSKLYLEHGLRGIRGELADGLPSVEHVGLPALYSALKQGASIEEAGVSALLALMAAVADTNLIARGGLEGWKWTAQRTKELLHSGSASKQAALILDQELIQRNLSPGGCADLLAITYFLYFLQNWKI